MAAEPQEPRAPAGGSPGQGQPSPSPYSLGSGNIMALKLTRQAGHRAAARLVEVLTKGERCCLSSGLQEGGRQLREASLTS